MHFLRIFFYTWFAFVLMACGGGGESSGGDASATFDELSLDDDEFDQYTGVTTAADIDASVMDLFVSIVLSDSYDFPTDFSNSEVAAEAGFPSTVNSTSTTLSSASSVSSESIKVDETEDCVGGGSQKITGTVNEDLTAVLEVSYSQCSDGNTTFNGNVSVKIVDGSDSNYEAISFYKKLLISKGNSRLSLSGRQQVKESDSGRRVEIISDLVLVDQRTETQIRLENYKSTSSCPYCTRVSDATFDGRVYHSEFGYLDVSTPAPLNENDSYSNNGYVGQLRFMSSSGQEFLITYAYAEVYKRHTRNHKEYSVRAQMDKDSDGEFDQEIVFPFTHAFQFEIYDLADSDGDTMTDGWERLFALDPLQSEDAAFDSDSDGYTNLEEFLYGGNPISEAEVPRVTDLSVELSESYGNVRAGRPQSILVTIDNPNEVYGAENVTVIVTKSVETEWYNDDVPGWTILNENQISRTIESISDDSRRAVSFELLGEPGEYTLTVSISSDTTDTNLLNNQHLLVASFADRQSNVGLTVNPPSNQFNFSSYDSAVVNHEHSFGVFLTHGGPDDSKNTVFRMSLPEHVDVLSASYLVDDVSSGDCTVSEEIHCELGTIFHNGASFKGYVQIDVRGVSEGLGEYTATITSDSVDTDPLDNSVTKEMFVGQSLNPIQDQIFAAQEPIEINLGAGMYVGSLNFTNKGVSVIGSDGPEQTIVRTISPDNELASFYMGTNSSLRNIHFSGREATTYSSPAIEISGDNLLIEKNTFEHNGTNVVGINGWATNVKISGNIFRNSKSNNSLCHVVGVDGPGPYRIENNLIYDTDCTAIMMFKSFNQPSQISVSTIVNNTIVNNVVGISDTIMYESSDFKIANNIFVENQTGIAIREDRANLFEDPYELPAVNNNLFFENDNSVSISQLLDVSYNEGSSNLHADPFFANKTSFDFELSAESPAIDVGSQLDAPSYDLNNNIRPLDGDGDGISEIDIGAFERDE